MRQPLVVGNWKMQGSLVSVEALLSDLVSATPAAGVEVAVCPTFIHLGHAFTVCGHSFVALGAQDCSHAKSGAHTGEVSAAMLAEVGCRWVILGHSERRQHQDESDALIAAKLVAAVEAGLRPIVCVGETRQQRDAGTAQAVVSAQLAGALQGQANLGQLVVAYEPVWAIGTGLTATPEQAQQMHAFMRVCLAKITGVDATATRILYGGSVKPDNAANLFVQPDIDGALVGGAALVAADFLAIINAAAA